MIKILFEESNDIWPDVEIGPFIWIEVIGCNMFGCRKDGEEAEEIAGLNRDGTWDTGQCARTERRSYNRWTIVPV